MFSITVARNASPTCFWYLNTQGDMTFYDRNTYDNGDIALYKTYREAVDARYIHEHKLQVLLDNLNAKGMAETYHAVRISPLGIAAHSNGTLVEYEPIHN